MFAWKGMAGIYPDITRDGTSDPVWGRYGRDPVLCAHLDGDQTCATGGR